MPAMYAHQRFGDLVYGELPAEIQRRIDPHRDLYNIGLQGPDIFFYADPILWAECHSMGISCMDRAGMSSSGRHWSCTVRTAQADQIPRTQPAVPMPRSG